LRSGTPNISMMHASWSLSSSPGNSGYPVNSSTTIHPATASTSDFAPGRPGAAPGGSHLDRDSFTLGRGAGPQIVARPPNLAVLLTHFVGQLIRKKTCKFDAIRRRILRLKCTKFDFRWGSAQTPLGNLQHSPDPVAVFKGAYF